MVLPGIHTLQTNQQELSGGVGELECQQSL